MTRVEALEGEIQKLTGTEFAQLRDWLLEEDWDRWDEQIQKDAAGGKLEDLFAQALAAHQAGESREL